MMGHDSSGQRRLPFVVADDFLETAFERRFQGILRQAWQNRSWHIIAALPGSGKSWGIGDLVLHCGAYKEATGATRLPILAVRAPSNSAREAALATILAAPFGVIPKMTGAALRIWLVQEMAHDGVECIIEDDAHELTLPHLALLKELTDNLAAPPFQRRVGLCMVAAMGSNVVPFRATLAGPEPLWRQFRGRMDTEHPYYIVPGHTEEEVYEILMTFEQLYRDQLPDLLLSPRHDIPKKKLLTDMSNLTVSSLLRLDYLAQLLAASTNNIVATTYQHELARIYNTATPSAKQLGGISWAFRLCPECIAQKRLLKRTLALSAMTCCLDHKISLLNTCQCGVALQLFHSKALPFTCYKCGLDWGRLPQNQTEPKQLVLEQKRFLFYEFFFSKGSPTLLASGWRLFFDYWDEHMRGRVIDDEANEKNVSFYEKTHSLSDLIHILVDLNFSPHDVIISAKPLPWRTLKWLKFDCPVPTCPYTMHDTSSL